MRHASIIKLLLIPLLAASAAHAEPKREPLPNSIESAKAGPYVQTSFDTPLTPPKTPEPEKKPENSDKPDNKATNKPLPKSIQIAKEGPYTKTSLDKPPAIVVKKNVPESAKAEPAPAATLPPPLTSSKGKYIKIPAQSVDVTPPPPSSPTSNEKMGSDGPLKAEADSVINDLEDLSLTPPPPPTRDAKTGDIILPKKSRTVVIERDSVLLDASALNTIMSAQNRDYLVSYSNTMGKSLRENLELLSQFYGFSVVDQVEKKPDDVQPKENKPKPKPKKQKKKNKT